MELRYDIARVGSPDQDDIAASGIRIKYCEYPTWSKTHIKEFNGTKGDWKGMVSCS